MYKINIIIGQSASGKTTFVKNNFCLEPLQLVDKPFKHTISQAGVCLVGDYTSNKRCCGADLLSMTIQPQIIEFVQNNIAKYNSIVMEGDRINQIRVFNAIANLKVPTKLYYFYCTLEDSCNRRRETGSEANEIFVKITITKSQNMKLYAKKLGFDIEEINTGTKTEPKQKGLF